MAKTAAGKRLERELNISVRKAEWQLDANAYLEEQWQWVPGRLHHEYLCQQMFLHATATGWIEHDHAIHQGLERIVTQNETWGWNLPPWNSFTPTPQEEIEDLYWDVYKLQRLPGRGQHEEATVEYLCKEILDSIKECLQLKWPSAQP